MKAIKLILVISILLAYSISIAQPQGGGQRGKQQGPPPIPTNEKISQMVSDLVEELTLTSEQESKILEIYKEHFDIIKEKITGNSRPKREEMQALNTALKDKVETELTEEQISKYEAYLKEQTSQRPKR